ncbi:hypothetical protein NQ314_018855 [Rhamnusium bicolor]|uniref:DH domain-containing protein n=1 Tax=Rhamnusium bicolor TaxID=1586634 RepID=A0AAV8WP60_9CUCU|nr:hypothetical protein NQ314_018855 [Rhamnusium bicolor]
MSRSASKRVIKKDYTQDELEGRTREDNFKRMRSVFEIRRPNKSPNSTLRKSKSTSVLSIAQNSDDEDIKYSKDQVFVRNSSSRSSIRSTNKFKKGSYRQNLKDQEKTKNDLGDIVKTNILVDELSRKLRKKKDSKDTVPSNLDFSLDKDHFTKFVEIQEKLKEIYTVGSHDKPDSEDEASRNFEGNIGERKFIKNSNKSKTHYYSHDCLFSKPLGSSDKSSKELIAQRQITDGRKSIKSFAEAEYEGETETYRKSLVLEMDLEAAKMKLDGFIDEDGNTNTESDINIEMEELHYSKVSRYKQLFEGMFNELDKDMQIFQNEYESRINQGLNTCLSDQERLSDCQECMENLDIQEEKTSMCGQDCTEERTFLNDEDYHSTYNDTVGQEHERNLEDEFCESLGDDLENGSYFVEAYNDDGRELIIVELSIERRTVNFDKPFSLKSIQNSFNNAEIVFQENNDKSLNVITDPKELIHENAELVSYGPHSNRSTLYSTTSRDSDIFDTDDEGIGMGNIEQRNCVEDDAYNNVRRETFCDHKGVVRIERIGYPETVHGLSYEEGNEPQSPVSRNNSFTQKGTLSYIIDEIKSTEKKYVEDLQKVVNKYMPYIERHTPPNLIGKNCYIFGNLEMLLRNQKQFSNALENCDEEVEDVITTFINFEHLFELYPNYFKNKPKADIVLREFSPIVKRAQEKFKERLDLSAYLLTPLQRLGKYKLFLENIGKQLQKLELPTRSATMALEIIKREMSKGNDFVAIESIENSSINSFADDCTLFNNIENYIYCDSIKMNDLRIATFEDLTIHLTDFTKCKKMSKSDKFTYVLEAKTEKIKDAWRHTIEGVLWQQLLKVKG